MSLRRRSLSPTANFLRNSRLFAIPNPLPRPGVGDTSNKKQRVSDSATLPYPTHQAIVTTPSSLARGDWGLKRPLPARSHILQTSNPVLRIKQLDAVEQVTDFDSAADHVRTREKWAEMNAPILRTGLAGRDRSMVTNARNAKAGDTKYVPTIPPELNRARHSLRWKHEGPWLPSMSAEDFMAYINKQLSGRRDEFHKYLVAYAKDVIYHQRRVAAKHDSDMPLDAVEADAYQSSRELEWSNMSSSDIISKIRELRAECAADPLTSRLVQKLIIPFLRLPPMRVKNALLNNGPNITGEPKTFVYDTTPLTTHPSAGLGYLRTKAYMTNHPILGPQKESTPIEARVIQPRVLAGNQSAVAYLGVGGFVTEDEIRSTGPTRNNTSNVEFIDVRTEGGLKIMVEPMNASIAPDGKVHVKVFRRAGESVSVARGYLDDKPPVPQAAEAEPLDLNIGKSGVKELDKSVGDRERKFQVMLERELQRKEESAREEVMRKDGMIGGRGV
ncbi:hypothetical protein CC78DRAFT_527151 [Lojkania enalia]|uniref:Uncharacterized protein n=1 Tax=Lojkania enalia TaxID=147567 RepID=A0A9P4JVF5_9PLEO|nr:hypothetical protein CC78DRAFT_527151 [Didymosphaeria enalia]